MNIEQKITDLLKDKGPCTVKEIQDHLNNHSEYIANTLRQMRRLSLITKINEHYTHGSMEKVIERLKKEQSMKSDYNIPFNEMASPITKALCSVQLTNCLSDKQMQQLIDECSTGLVMYILVLNLTRNLPIVPIPDADENVAVAYLASIKNTLTTE